MYNINVKFVGGYWEDPKNVRRFFDEYALKHEFDPLNAENWYPVKTRDVVTEKV